MATETPPAPTNLITHRQDDMADWMSKLPKISTDNTPGQEPLPPNVQPPEHVTEDPDSAAALAAAARLREQEKLTTPPPETPAPEPKPETPEPPKPAEKPAEKPPETHSPEDKWPRTATDWETFKTNRRKEREELTRKLQAAEKERDEFKIQATKAPAIPADYETVKKERDQLSDTLKAISVENHPRFKEYYRNKIGAQIDLAKRIVGAEKGSEIAEVLGMPDSAYKDQKFSELTADLSPLQQSRLGGVLNTLTQLQTERDSEISKAKDNYRAMQADNEVKAKAKQDQFTKLFNDTLSKLNTDGEGGNPAFLLQEGKDDWNREVQGRIESAKQILFGQAPPEAVISTALNAQAYPVVLKMALAQQQRIKALETQISELTKAAPKPAAVAKPESTTPEQPVTPKVGSRPMEVTGDWMKRLPKLGQQM